MEIKQKKRDDKMQHIEEIKDYWNMRANGFSMAVEEELKTEYGKKFFEIPSQKKMQRCWMTVQELDFSR